MLLVMNNPALAVNNPSIFVFFKFVKPLTVKFCTTDTLSVMLIIPVPLARSSKSELETVDLI